MQTAADLISRCAANVPQHGRRFMLHGVAREMGLGKYPDISLARARELAAEARAQRAAGKNPIIERANATAMSFRACAERYIADRRDGWKNAKHADQWSATLSQYAYPKLGKVPVGAVDTASRRGSVETHLAS